MKRCETTTAIQVDMMSMKYVRSILSEKHSKRTSSSSSSGPSSRKWLTGDEKQDWDCGVLSTGYASRTLSWLLVLQPSQIPGCHPQLKRLIHQNFTPEMRQLKCHWIVPHNPTVDSLDRQGLRCFSDGVDSIGWGVVSTFTVLPASIMLQRAPQSHRKEIP